MQIPENFANALLDTFDKSAVNLFRDWMAQHPGTNKWIIGADFALRDRNRPGDCFAFSIIPYEQTFEEFRDDAVAALPRDLKNSREIKPGGVAWLRDHRAFHVVFPINADRQFFFDEGKRPVQVARESIAISTKHAVEMERGKELVRRMKLALEKSKANAFNVGLFTDLTILALLLPVLTLIIARERKPEPLGWFCDRDSMTNWCEGVIWDIALQNLAGLSERLGVDTGTPPTIGLPDRSSDQEHMWFDHLVRSADWLAGTMATWDWKANQLPAEQAKYRQMVEEVCADCTNIVFLPIIMDKNGLKISRLFVDRKASG